VSIFNAGGIIGTSGTAVQFAGTGNTLTIAPTSVIVGNAVGTGSDLFQLGGTGTGSFDAGLIGPAAQYRGFGAYAKVDNSTWTLSGNNALALPWTVRQGTLDVTGNLANSPFTVEGGLLSLTGTIGSATVNAGTMSVLPGGLSGPVVVNGGALNDSGTVGSATVNGGVMSVLTGGVAGPVSVNGGVLTGEGTVGATQINAGGTFAPGEFGTPGTLMTVSGNLAFQSGALYLVQLNPSTASLANVTGATSLSGNLQANFAPGTYSAGTQYDVLHAAGGLSGTFAAVSATGAPGFAVRATYTNTDVLLNLTAALGVGSSGLGANQQAVANVINNFFNTGGMLPPGFLNLFGLSGSTLNNALSQIDGEPATGSQQTTFDAMSQFMGLLTDPFISGRGSPVSAGE
jgi:autotransporter-associated beta strand protein